MPINPNTGLFEEGVYHSKGGGVFGALDVMNQFKAQQLARQAESQRRIQALEAMARSADSPGMDIFTTPEGRRSAGSFGISEETGRSISEAAPRMAFKKRLGELKKLRGTDPLTEDDVFQAALETGVNLPTGTMGFLGRGVTAESRDKATKQKGLAELQKAALAAYKISQAGGDPEETSWAKVQRALAPSPFYQGLSAEEQQAIFDAVTESRGEASSAALPMVEARRTKSEAEAAAASSRADYLDKVGQPTADLRKAQAEKARRVPAGKTGGGVGVKDPQKRRMQIKERRSAIATKKAALGGAFQTALTKAALAQLDDEDAMLKAEETALAAVPAVKAAPAPAPVKTMTAKEKADAFLRAKGLG